jgi:hypothetical protein
MRFLLQRQMAAADVRAAEPRVMLLQLRVDAAEACKPTRPVGQLALASLRRTHRCAAHRRACELHAFDAARLRRALLAGAQPAHVVEVREQAAAVTSVGSP